MDCTFYINFVYKFVAIALVIFCVCVCVSEVENKLILGTREEKKIKTCKQYHVLTLCF